MRRYGTKALKTDEQTVYSHEISPTDRNRLRWKIRFSEKSWF